MLKATIAQFVGLGKQLKLISKAVKFLREPKAKKAIYFFQRFRGNYTCWSRKSNCLMIEWRGEISARFSFLNGLGDF
jgi:hypothetical protein